MGGTSKAAVSQVHGREQRPSARLTTVGEPVVSPDTSRPQGHRKPTGGAMGARRDPRPAGLLEGEAVLDLGEWGPVT